MMLSSKKYSSQKLKNRSSSKKSIEKKPSNEDLIVSATRTQFSLIQEQNEKANKAKQPYKVKGPNDDLTEEELAQEM